MSERAAQPGEFCTCGRPATIVFVHDDRETGYCGLPGVSPVLPCRFCSATQHNDGTTSKCPQYRIRPAEAVTP